MSDLDPIEPMFVPSFILDVPSLDDDLSSHQPIAEAIAAVVRSDRVKIIGVIGLWGSGKSTVVKMAQSLLEKDGAGREGTARKNGSSIACYTFDAWQHQSDPHRRAFLDTLLNFLEAHPAYEPLRQKIPTWRLNLEELNKLRDIVTTESTPRLSLGSMLFALSVLLIPLGVKLLGDGVPHVGSLDGTRAHLMFTLGWGLALLPIVLVLSLGVLQALGLMETSVFSIIAGKAAENRREVKLKTEPTSDDFQRAFKAFAKTAKDSGTRLVVIVDNLDRLPPEEALTIWSTVRALFLRPDGSRDEDREDDLPTLIMPLDQSAIEKIYKGQEGKADVLARSFIDKTFDVVFHLPKPVTSRRQSYLSARLSQAFDPHITPQDLHDVTVVFEKHGQTGDGSPPGPRAINAFVNDVAVIWLQRQRQAIPIPLIAYFVLRKVDIRDDVRGFVKTNEPELVAFGDEGPNQLAALHYGVLPDAARELFLDEPLREAIKGKSSASFKTLSGVPGFTTSLLGLLDRAIEHQGGVRTLALAELLSTYPQNDVWVQESWTRIRRIALAQLPKTPFEAEDAPGLTAVLAASTPEQRVLFLRALVEALDQGDGKIVQHDGGKAYRAFALRLIDALREAGLEDEQVPVPGGVSPFFVMMLQDLPVEAARKLELKSATGAQLISGLIENVTDEMRSLTVKPIVRAMLAREPETDFTRLLPALSNAMASATAPFSLVAGEVTFDLLERSPVFAEAFAAQVPQTNLEAGFYAAWLHGEEPTIAQTAALVLKANGSLSVSGLETWESRLASSLGLAGAIDAAAKAIGLDPSLVWLRDRIRSHPADAPLIQAWASLKLMKPEVSVEEIFAEPMAVNWLLPDVLKPMFWTQVSKRAGFAAFLRRLPISEAAPILAATDNVQASRRTRALLPALLAAQSKELWIEAVEGGQEPFALAARLTDADSTRNAGPNAYAALLETLHRVIENQSADYRERWFVVFDRLAPSSRETLSRQLAEATLRAASQGHRMAPLLARAGPEFAISPVFTEQSDRTIRELAFALLTDEPGRFWLAANEKIVKAWLKRAAKSTRDTFVEQLKARAEAGESVAPGLFEAFGR